MPRAGGLEPPPDTEAGRFGSRLLDREIGNIRDLADHNREVIEKGVRERYSAVPSPREVLTALSLVQNAQILVGFEANHFANLIGFGGLDAVKARTRRELAQAFKTAEGCEPWLQSIKQGEQERERLDP